VGAELGLRPALTWRSRIGAVKRLEAGEAVSYGHRYRLERDAWIATVPVGYADGYPRQLTNRGEVLIRGRRHGVAGTVTMDQVLVDCGDEEIQVGEEVVLIGNQGNETIGADALGRLFGTIGYEIVSRIGERVPRRYV
jgi:alanine racemase